jgi:predicted RNase H-like HicB family nuclease
MNYNTKAVCKIVGLSKRQVDYWDREHFIKPSVSEAAGHGSVRLYSFTDLIQFKVAKRLMGAGLSLQKIRKSVNYLKKNMPDIKEPLLNLKFLTDSNSIFVLTKDNNKILDTLNGGQLVFVFGLDQIVQELQGEVASLFEERKYSVTVHGRKYEVILHPDTEDGGFWVECPALPGCASQGDTVEEALSMIKDAIEGYLEVLEEEKSHKVKKAKAL